MAEKPQRFEVIGARTVGGVAPGGTVELDPEQVNVEALAQAGHIKPVPVGGKRQPEQGGGEK